MCIKHNTAASEQELLGDRKGLTQLVREVGCISYFQNKFHENKDVVRKDIKKNSIHLENKGDK